MARTVKAYLACTVALGLVVFAVAVSGWTCANPMRLLIYLSLAVWAGTLKVRLPGITGTFSLNFLFVLIGIAELTFGETVLMATVSMIVQCIWRPKVTPKLEQVVFNANAVAIGVGVAFLAAHFTPAPPPVQLVAAAAVYFVANTAIVSGILGLVEQRSFTDVWSRWLRWSLSYYVVGVGVVAAIVLCNHRFGWPYALLFLPVMYLEYFHFRSDIDDRNLSGNSC
jgi:hypothetical protein